MTLTCCLFSAGAVSQNRSYVPNFTIIIIFFLSFNDSKYCSETAAFLFILNIGSVWKSTQSLNYTDTNSLQMHPYFQIMNIGLYCDTIMLTTLTCWICFTLGPVLQCWCSSGVAYCRKIHISCFGELVIKVILISNFLFPFLNLILYLLYNYMFSTVINVSWIKHHVPTAALTWRHLSMLMTAWQSKVPRGFWGFFSAILFLYFLMDNLHPDIPHLGDFV